MHIKSLAVSRSQGSRVPASGPEVAVHPSFLSVQLRHVPTLAVPQRTQCSAAAQLSSLVQPTAQPLPLPFAQYWPALHAFVTL